MDIKKHDHEARMAKAELAQVAKNAIALYKMVQEGDNLDGWVSSYITLANDHLNSVHEHMEYEMHKKAAIEQGPREFEESVQSQIKNKLEKNWLQIKGQ
jgi:hypothetical protein